MYTSLNLLHVIIRYELDIGAIDEGTPSRVGTTVLIVTVIDTDDNSPRFERSFYDVAISEGMSF